MAEPDSGGGSALCTSTSTECCAQHNDRSKKRHMIDIISTNAKAPNSSGQGRGGASCHAGSSKEKASTAKKKKKREFDWSRAQFQRVLLKIAYNGEAYAVRRINEH